MLQVDEIFAWSPWQPLKDCWRGSLIPKTPGLYRIRRMRNESLDYIGQTGGKGGLRKRLSPFLGVFSSEMPYRDPHTAAPALWSLHHSSQCDFEVSVLPVEGTTAWRKGLEALAISLYRYQHRSSPSVNFGRMPRGYRMSSSNNKKLIEAGKRFRGGPTTEVNSSHSPSLPPLGTLEGNPHSTEWCGHRWSDWVPLSEVTNHLGDRSLGLYRIRSQNRLELVYVGQGKIKTRLNDHWKKALAPQDKQGQIFAQSQPLECSWISNHSWLSHQRLELENDLIASCVLVTEKVPVAQFLGKSEF